MFLYFVESCNKSVVGKWKLTSVQKTHWHCVMVVICSRGNSPRHSLQETSGSTANSHVGRYRAVVIFTTTELRSPKEKLQFRVFLNNKLLSHLS